MTARPGTSIAAAAPERGGESADIAGAMTDQDIANRLTGLAAAVQRRPPVRDWVDAYCEGSAFGSEVAAAIFGCSTDTAVRRANAAAEKGQPLGILLAGTWLFDRERVLAWIEREEGKPGRLEAETRAARKNAELRSSPQKLPLIASFCGDDRKVIRPTRRTLSE
jgi:hypothetical protein